MRRVLWIDDNSEFVYAVTGLLDEQDVSVDLSDGQDLEGRFPLDVDLIIVDLNLSWRLGEKGGQKDVSGLELLRRIYRDHATQERIDSGTTRVLILSQHLTEASWRLAVADFARETGIRAVLRSKYGMRAGVVDLSDTGSIRGYIAGAILDAIASKSPPPLLESLDETVEAVTGVDPFNITIDAYSSLSDLEKATVQDRAYEDLEVAAERLFRITQHDWLVYCGSAEEPVRGGPGEPPTGRDLHALARELGHPTFVVLRSYAGAASGPVIEELDRPARSGVSSFVRRLLGGDRPALGDVIFRCDGTLNDYPTITLELAKRLRTFHLDTGSPLCWLRAADIREHGVHLDVVDRRMVYGRRGRYYSYALEEPVECTLHDQLSGNTVAVLVRGIAIEDFGRWELARFCADFACRFDDVNPNGECIVRAGIVGRSLLTDNELAVTISAHHEQTSVRRLKA